MYKEETRRFPGSTEKRYFFNGNFGAKGEKRAAKEKPTPEQMEYVNRMTKARKIRYYIKGNFSDSDLFVTLTYRKGTRKSLKEAAEDIRRLFDRLRRKFKKLGHALKYIYLIEIGSRGGIHAHVIINECGQTTRLISKLWEHGHPNFKNLYEEGDYQQLADYMAKVPQGEDRVQQCTKTESIYSHSRNLILVKPEVKTYTRRTVRKYIEAIEGGATTHRDAAWIPEGQYIDTDSIRLGTNPYTGLSFLEYTLRPIKKTQLRAKGGTRYV